MKSSDGFFYEGEVFYPFQDMLFNALLSFTFMFLIAFMLINPVGLPGKVDPKAEFIITATWPDNHADDIDLYVEDPSRGVVWYFQREAGLMHLDRDDRGNFRDTIVRAGLPAAARVADVTENDRIRTVLNQETVTLRGFAPGEYTVNVHQYLATGTEPVPVSVTIEKLNPTVSLVYYKTVELVKRAEVTIVRFTLDQDGNVTNIGDEPKRLTRAR